MGAGLADYTPDCKQLSKLGGSLRSGECPSHGHPQSTNLSALPTSGGSGGRHFDPSTAEHVYRIDWQPGSLAWYVDGVRIRTATTGVPTPDPSGRGDCSKIKFILRPGSASFKGVARNYIRYLSYNKTSSP